MKQYILLIFATCFILPSFADTTYVYQLPFEEKFTTGLFTTNEWTVEGINWQITGQQGNPLPSAMFTFAPADTNYSKSMISAPINGSFISGKIFLNYDILLDDGIASGQEKLSAEVFDGSQWVTVYSDSSVGDFNWKRNHVDITEAAKGDTFQVRFRAYGVNTYDINYWLIDNITVYRKCEEPTDLDAYYEFPYDQDCLLRLDWQAPEWVNPSQDNWLFWDDGVNYSGIGLGADTTWAAAVHFYPTQLAEYAGTTLTKIRFIPAEATGSSFVLKVWIGANANILVSSQPVSSFISGIWNEFTLETPVPISGFNELWFGYEVTQAAVDFPAGCDNGPAISGFGNMININGVWETLWAINPEIDYNWNIQGLIELPVNPDTSGIVGYNIYRDELWVGFTNEMYYYDSLYGLPEMLCYNVTAKYEDCESEYSNLDCELNYCYVGTTFIEFAKIRIYPNPCSNYTVFEYSDGINQIIICDVLGKKKQSIEPDQQTYQLDLENYQNGIYLVKFVSSRGESLTKKMIVTK